MIADILNQINRMIDRFSENPGDQMILKVITLENNIRRLYVKYKKTEILELYKLRLEEARDINKENGLRGQIRIGLYDSTQLIREPITMGYLNINLVRSPLMSSEFERRWQYSKLFDRAAGSNSGVVIFVDEQNIPELRRLINTDKSVDHLIKPEYWDWQARLDTGKKPVFWNQRITNVRFIGHIREYNGSHYLIDPEKAKKEIYEDYYMSRVWNTPDYRAIARTLDDGYNVQLITRDCPIFEHGIYGFDQIGSIDAYISAKPSPVQVLIRMLG